MEAFEQFVALAMETENLVVSGALKFPVALRTQKTAYEEWQTHGYEVDLIGARSDKLVLATVKSFFGSHGVNANDVRGISGNTKGYLLLNNDEIREEVVRKACERFGYSEEQLEMRLYVGKFAGGSNETLIRGWAENERVGSGPIRVIGAAEVVERVRTLAEQKQYRDNAVLASLKVLSATGALTPRNQTEVQPYVTKRPLAAEDYMNRTEIDDQATPMNTLLEAVRVLHLRGAHRIQIYPYFYGTGHWRCPIVVDGADPYKREDTSLLYSSGAGWRLPGHESDVPIDAESAADCIWAVLSEEERTTAMHPDVEYVAWYERLMIHLTVEDVPFLFGDGESPYQQGIMTLSGRYFFGAQSQQELGVPLPPGNSLDFFLLPINCNCRSH